MDWKQAEQLINKAIKCLEKVNGELSPDSYGPHAARSLQSKYARVVKLGTFGEVSLADRVGDAAELARIGGTSVGRARRTLDTSRQLAKTPVLEEALRRADLSFDQAQEIAKTEAVVPGSAGLLVDIARHSKFHVLKEEARKIRLEELKGPGLEDRQREARYLHHRVTDLGMIHIEGELEPHIGTPIVNRLQAAARRLARASERREPFDRYLADALPELLADTTRTSGGTEMVVLVSYEVAERGWSHVEDDEHCKIPGIGQVDPEVARRIAGDAFLSGVFFDGTDLRQIKRWGRSVPAPIRTALNLGDPPEFDGVKCVDCGNRFWIELDHHLPHAAGGPISMKNSRPRCWRCHQKKTRADRRAGRLRRPTNGPGAGDREPGTTAPP
jgi:hypothetical protein